MDLFFDGKENSIASVTSVTPKTDKKGFPTCEATLVVQMGAEDKEVSVTVPAWYGYLIEELTRLAANPGQAYYVKLQSNGKFTNVIGIDGVEAPADWQAKVEAMGYGQNRGGAGGNGGPGNPNRQAAKDPMTVKMHAQAIAARLPWVKSMADFDAAVQHLMDQIYAKRGQGGGAERPRAAAPARDPL